MASRFYPAGDSARRAAFQSERTVFRPELRALEAGNTPAILSVSAKTFWRGPCNLVGQRHRGDASTGNVVPP
jgi:hypothetical protein